MMIESDKGRKETGGQGDCIEIRRVAATGRTAKEELSDSIHIVYCYLNLGTVLQITIFIHCQQSFQRDGIFRSVVRICIRLEMKLLYKKTSPSS